MAAARHLGADHVRAPARHLVRGRLRQDVRAVGRGSGTAAARRGCRTAARGRAPGCRPRRTPPAAAPDRSAGPGPPGVSSHSRSASARQRSCGTPLEGGHRLGARRRRLVPGALLGRQAEIAGDVGETRRLDHGPDIVQRDAQQPVVGDGAQRHRDQTAARGAEDRRLAEPQMVEKREHVLRLAARPYRSPGPPSPTGRGRGSRAGSAARPAGAARRSRSRAPIGSGPAARPPAAPSPSSLKCRLGAVGGGEVGHQISSGMVDRSASSWRGSAHSRSRGSPARFTQAVVKP